MKSSANFYFALGILLDISLIAFCAFLSVVILTEIPSSFDFSELFFLTGYGLCIFIPLNLISGVYKSFNLVEAPRFSLSSLVFFAFGISLFLAMGIFDWQSQVSPKAFFILPLLYICGLTLLRTIGNRCFEILGASRVGRDCQREVYIYGTTTDSRALFEFLRVSGRDVIKGFVSPNDAGLRVLGLPTRRPADLVSEPNATLLIPDKLVSHALIKTLDREGVSYKVAQVTEDLSLVLAGSIDTTELYVNMLGREYVPPSQDVMKSAVSGNRILITGAGGSIGSELVRVVINYGPEKLCLFDCDEYRLYRLNEELNLAGISEESYQLTLGSLLDREFIGSVVKEFCPDVVLHASAYKHVPLLQSNIWAAISNNVIGTQNLLEALREIDFHKFVLISSDKAVRPPNLMGATKRLVEWMIQIEALKQPNVGKSYVTVRFGNVIGSSGSVFPKLVRQILGGMPVTVTHPDVTRYFMLVREAAELVIQAATLGDSGGILLLDMGKPVKIEDAAKQLISILSPNKAVEILYTGLRPGEKLHEELLVEGCVSATSHPKIYKAVEGQKITAEKISLLDWVCSLDPSEADISAKDLIINEIARIDEGLDKGHHHSDGGAV